MAEFLEIIVEVSDAEEAASALGSAGIEFDLAASQGADGTEIVSLLVPLGSHVVTAVAAFYIARVRANKYVKLKYKGFEIVGASADDVINILSKITRPSA